jgi:hypothetical protein
VLYRARTYPGSRSSGRQIWTPGQELHLRCLLLCRQLPSLLGHRARRTVCLYTAYGANYGIAIWEDRWELNPTHRAVTTLDLTTWLLPSSNVVRLARLELAESTV